MKIVFRVDSSGLIGSGHFFRCKTLATELRKKGVDIHFVVRDLDGNLSSVLQEDAFRVSLLTAPEELTENNGVKNQYSSWLTVSQRTDALETINVLDDLKYDWLIIDHYSLDIEWEMILKPYVKKILVIDDLQGKRHYCDLFLNQNFSLPGEDRFGSDLPEHAIKILGPSYALLRPEYREYRKKKRVRNNITKKIFVFMGGSDNVNATSLVLRVLSLPEFAHIELDLVIGASNTHKAEITDLAEMRGSTNIHLPRAHLADLMSGADLAIGGSGGTTWERCCLGLPSLSIGVSNDQGPIAEALDEAGIVCYLGMLKDVTISSLSKKISAVLSDSSKLREMSNRSLELVDGLGVDRIIKQLFLPVADKI